jgi:hypothetical protein
MLYNSDMLHYVRKACLRYMLRIMYRINRKRSPKQPLLVYICVQTQCARCEAGNVTKKDWLWSAIHSFHKCEIYFHEIKCITPFLQPANLLFFVSAVNEF